MKFIPLAQCIKKTVAILTTSLYLAQISIVFAAVPVLMEVTPIGSTGDTTPNYTFSSDQAGTITYGGSCTSATTSAVVGNNTITLKPVIGLFFASGTYSNCTLTLTNGSSESSLLNISSFTIDTTVPVISQVTPVTTPTSDTTPNYVFTSNEAGTITYGGSCTSSTTSAVVGNNTITFNTLSDGTYTNCTITVTDSAGNVSSPALAINTFVVDASAPVISQVTPVSTPTSDTTPNYVFTSNEAGTITYGGSCTSSTTSAVVGNNTITFNTLSDGTYTNCTITVKDASNNTSNVLAVNTFVIDSSMPVISVVTPVTTPSSDTTPNYVFTSNKAGTITYGGSCTSSTTSAVVGNNTITFNTLSAGTYSNCTILVTDSFAQTSNVLAVNSFTIDTIAPVISQVTPVTTPTSDTTPNYVFTSNEAGTITYGGSCTSSTTSAVVGNNTITFNTLSDGTYTNCTITVKDASNNTSNVLAVNTFVIDSIGPVLAQVTPVPVSTPDTTPNYTFSSTKAGTITYSGGCTSATTSAVVGNNTITFNLLSAGTYSLCTIMVTDGIGHMSNNLLITSFTVDTLAPIISQTSQIPFVSFDSTPSVNINTSEAGTFVFGGACASSQTSAVVGNNTVTLDYLVNGFYSNCTITLTDAAGYMSNVLTLNSFFVDATVPVISLVTPIVTPSTDSTPNLTFSSSKSGTITYGGSCSGTLPVVVGNNTITLNNLVPATYTNCTITVTDIHTNKSNVLAIPSFTINIAAGAPVLAIVTPVVTPSTSTLPVVTFSSSKAGTIIYGGACSSTMTSAVFGNNVITFNTLVPGTYTDCTVAVYDSAGNTSLALSIPSFTINAPTNAPVIAMVTPVVTPSSLTSPVLTFSSTKAGTITYGGSCTSATTSAVVGNNTITFNTLALGTYTNCTVTVTDSNSVASNVLSVPSFTISAVSGPTIPTNLLPNNTSTSALGWNYSWNPSTGTGPITYEVKTSQTSTVDGTGSLTTGVYSSGTITNTSIYFNAIIPGVWYWQVRSIDAAGNISAWSPVAQVTKSATTGDSPVIAMVTPITTPSTTSTPSLVFSSSKAGTVTFGGACTSISTVAVFGNNIVVLNSLPAGTYSNCTITVTDATNNASNLLTIPTFTISSATSVNPSVPTNLLPNNTSISANGWDFSWNPSTGTGPLTYQVITSMTPTLNTSGALTTGIFSSGSLSATSVFFNGATPGIWYWQVRAQDSLGNFSAWSPLASVTKTTTVPTGPTVPTNLLPNNTSISANGWDFSWNPSTGTGPITYEVKTSLNSTVDSSGSLSSGVLSSGSLSTTSVFFNGATPGIWYWQVRARDSLGVYSQWSPLSTVTKI